jgi:hypothetical protein
MQSRILILTSALAMACIFIISALGGAVAEDVGQVRPDTGTTPLSPIVDGSLLSREAASSDLIGPEYRRQAPPWPQPEIPQKFGDDYSERAIFVHQDDSTYLDDLLYCSAIPAAVHWEGETRYNSLLISDEAIRENGNLLGDWLAYLEKTGAEPTIDFIGDVDPLRKAELTSYFNNPKASNDITNPTDVYDGACDIADYYWHYQRSQLGPDTAVLAYVPDTDGGTEVRKDTAGSQAGTFSVNTDISAADTSWLSFDISWADPGADTDYRIQINDPYALHLIDYSNSGTLGQVNPTNNKLYQNYGYNEVGLSPYYSYQPHSINTGSSVYQQKDYSGTLPAGDDSVYPIALASDQDTYQFGPVKKGQWIAVLTDWTYYMNSPTDYRDFDSFIYGPGKGPGDEHLLEAAHDPNTMLGTQPEMGYCYAEEAGMYNVTIHALCNSTGGDYTTSVYWGNVSASSTWSAGQINAGTDFMQYHYKEYGMTDEQMVESVTNGAVLASLINAPLLYTAGGPTPEVNVVQTLQDLGIDNLIVIDPSNQINTTGWTSSGFNIESVKSDKAVFNYIYNVSKAKGLDKSLILSAQGGPWFSGAALAGACLGAPAPALDGPEMLHIQSQATATWWQLIQLSDTYSFYPLNALRAPNENNMEDLADDFFAWIEGYNPDFNPDCGDTDGDGIPDNGINWDYSQDVDVIVVSPLNALKGTLDRAILGKAAVGRIPCSDPSVQWAVMNREMLYWKVGFSQADNPEDPGDSKPVADHWKKVGWTFNSYAHDDDIMDNDAGDQDDDDYCAVDDGGSNHLQYKPRESWPVAAASYGKSNEFHTYYDGIRDMLEDGTCYWSNNGHGHHYNVMETGIGYTGTITDPSDPKWAGPNPPPNSFIDAPLETTTGWDWFYDIENAHSTFATFQSCQVGGSAMPEYFMRIGAVGAIGGVVSRTLNEATIQSDRTTQGLFSGMSFGDAYRWGVDETSSMYSIKDGAHENGNYSDFGYTDDLPYRVGDTCQTLLYGFPDLVMINPTLWMDTSWQFPESGTDLEINVTIYNESGSKVTPDNLTVEVDSLSLTPVEMATGVYIATWPIAQGKLHHLRIETEKTGYTSPKGKDIIVKEYDLIVPQIQITPGEVNTSARYPKPLDNPLTNTNTNSAQAFIYQSDDTYTGLNTDLYSNGPVWEVFGFNVSSLISGDYYVLFAFEAKYFPYATSKGPAFSVEHLLYFNEPTVDYDIEEYKLDMRNLSIHGTYSLEQNPAPSNLTTRSYRIFVYDSGWTSSDMGINGNLGYNSTTGTFLIEDLDLSGLPNGDYYVKISASTAYTGTFKKNTTYFSVKLPIYLWGPELNYIGGLKQTLTIGNIRISTSLDPKDVLPASLVSQETFEVYDDNDTKVMFGLLKETDNVWSATVNVSSRPQGSYYVKVSFLIQDYGPLGATTSSFDITHIVKVTRPLIEYTPSLSQKMSAISIKAISSYSKVGEINDTNAAVHSYILMTGNGTATGIKGDLEWDFASKYWKAQDVQIGSLDEGSYFVRASVSNDNLSDHYNDSETFELEHIFEHFGPELIHHESKRTIDLKNFRVRSSFAGAKEINKTLATVNTYSVYRISDKTDMGITGDLVFANGFWQAYGINISSLPAGDYYVECKVGYKEKHVTGNATFSVRYELIVYPAKLKYDALNDILTVYEVRAYSDDPSLGNLDDQMAIKAQVRILDEEMNPVPFFAANLDYDGTYFYKDYVNASEKGLEDGIYYAEITFQAWLTDEVVNISEPYTVTLLVEGDDDDDDDDDILPSISILFAALMGLFALVLIVIVTVLIAIFMLSKRKKSERDLDESGDSSGRRKRAFDEEEEDEDDWDDDDWSDEEDDDDWDDEDLDDDDEEDDWDDEDLDDDDEEDDWEDEDLDDDDDDYDLDDDEDDDWDDEDDYDLDDEDFDDDDYDLDDEDDDDWD